MSKKERSRHHVKSVKKLALVSVSYVALVAVGASDVRAQASAPGRAGPHETGAPPTPPGHAGAESPDGAAARVPIAGDAGETPTERASIAAGPRRSAAQKAARHIVSSDRADQRAAAEPA